MMKNRPAIPRATRDAVLSEFNHRCAVCGRDRPQIHHIDEDPSNNDVQNLIPLCPNCHLIDQHNPTLPIEPDKLRLFRQFKDPIILGPQFEPLFRRLRFLDDIPDEVPVRELEEKAAELVEFVRMLQMGEFYSKRIDDLTRKVSRVTTISLYGGETEEQRRTRLTHQHQYREQLRTNRGQVYSLAVELLRYQPWEPPKQKRLDL